MLLEKVHKQLSADVLVSIHRKTPVAELCYRTPPQVVSCKTAFSQNIFELLEVRRETILRIISIFLAKMKVLYFCS